MNVLLVDAGSASAAWVAKILERVGYKVDVCSDPELAVRRANAEGHLCAVVDWMMPHIDGIELTRELKSETSVRHVVMISELAQPEARAHAIRAGVDAYVIKPCVPASLIAALRSAEAKIPRSITAPSESELRLMRHAGFTRLAEVARECFSQACNLELEIHPEVGLPPQACEISAGLGMMDISAAIEVHALLTTSRASGGELLEHMLGFKAADDEMILETLTELSNHLLGQLKVRFRDLGHDFTLSVGHPIEVGAPKVPVASHSVVLEHGRIALGVEVCLYPVTTRSVRAADLGENMILGEDLKNAFGALLVTKGTRLTSVIAARVRGMLGNREVQVASVGG